MYKFKNRDLIILFIYFNIAILINKLFKIQKKILNIRCNRILKILYIFFSGIFIKFVENMWIGLTKIFINIIEEF